MVAVAPMEELVRLAQAYKVARPGPVADQALREVCDCVERIVIAFAEQNQGLGPVDAPPGALVPNTAFYEKTDAAIKSLREKRLTSIADLMESQHATIDSQRTDLMRQQIAIIRLRGKLAEAKNEIERLTTLVDAL